LDLSRLNRNRVLIGGLASILLVVSLLFLPWYSLESNPQRVEGSPDFNPDAFICGTSDFECTGWEAFPINRWLLLLVALAPLILGYILARGHKLSWAPGEMTMVAGFAALVLIGYNGIIDRPGTNVAETGVGLDFGYWLALVAAATIAATGFGRAMESGGARARRAPGTV
jgi:hypothetical protein